jgi:rod shape-determining protein MreD
VKKEIILLAVLFSTLLQATVLNYFRIWGVKPDLLIVCVVFASLTMELRWAIAIGIFAGLLKDIFGTNPIGVSCLLFALWGFLIYVLTRKVVIDNYLPATLVVLLAVAINGLSYNLINMFFGKHISIGIFLRTSIIESIYTTAVAYWVFKKVWK